MYLLDTNVISELRKVEKGKGDLGVKQWASNNDQDKFYTSAVVMMELERGVLLMECKDPEQGLGLRLWLEQVIKTQFKDRILPLDAFTAEICAALYVPERSPENDAWIAAQALQHGLILITRNEKAFAELGAKVINPFF